MPASFKQFIQNHCLTLIFLALTLVAGAWTFLDGNLGAASRYGVPGGRFTHDSGIRCAVSSGN
jgi:hypothetical protein